MRKTKILKVDEKKITPKLITIINDLKKKLDQLESEVVSLEQNKNN